MLRQQFKILTIFILTALDSCTGTRWFRGNPVGMEADLEDSHEDGNKRCETPAGMEINAVWESCADVTDMREWRPVYYNTDTQGAPSFSTLIFHDCSMTKKMKIHDLSAQHIFPSKWYTTYECIPELVVTVPSARSTIVKKIKLVHNLTL